MFSQMHTFRRKRMLDDQLQAGISKAIHGTQRTLEDAHHKAFKL